MKRTAWGKHVACFSVLLTLMQVYKSFVIRRSANAETRGAFVPICVRVCEPVWVDEVLRMAVPFRGA